MTSIWTDKPAEDKKRKKKKSIRIRDPVIHILRSPVKALNWKP